eukprot:COSAG03_NODE_1413_length_4119_cov_2.952736_2_plen_125_part_00
MRRCDGRVREGSLTTPQRETGAVLSQPPTCTRYPCLLPAARGRAVQRCVGGRDRTPSCMATVSTRGWAGQAGGEQQRRSEGRLALRMNLLHIVVAALTFPASCALLLCDSCRLYNGLTAPKMAH